MIYEDKMNYALIFFEVENIRKERMKEKSLPSKVM